MVFFWICAGILLAAKQCPDTKTLSHVLWSLLNCLPAGDHQRPHKHNSVALDLAVKSAPAGVYSE
jgi:gentisate 1,2-dioxygenase